jgi:hypothetical protein
MNDLNISKVVANLLLKHNNGSFFFKKGDKIRRLVKSNYVPSTYGVYIFYGVTNTTREIIYIGAAGTLQQTGKYREQKLNGRLVNKQDTKTSRQKFLDEQIAKNGFNAIIIQWFVTVDERNNVPPAKAEADLLYAYYQTFKTLPKENHKF